MELVGRGGALILEEKMLAGDALIALVEPLIENPARLAEIGRQSAQLAITEPTSGFSRNISPFWVKNDRHHQINAVRIIYRAGI
jgi:hypothetical protein